jgi:hypothetical protein
MVACCLCVSAIAAEHDYYKYLRYPKELAAEVGRDQVEQEGGPNAIGYKRRTVNWWPRQGQDIVDIPDGAPLRTWTRNKGKSDKEALAGVSRSWTTSDDDTFKAHLIGFRGFGIETHDPRMNYTLTPAAVLRMENGERRAVLAYPPFHMMVSQDDHDFIHTVWQKEWKKLQATQSTDEYAPSKYRVKPDSLVLETKHYTFVSAPGTQHKSLWWMRPHELEKQNIFRQGTMEFAENLWTHVEAAGTSMPCWRRKDPWKKYNVLINLSVDGGYAGGGIGACDLRDAAGGPRGIGISHEFYHGQSMGGWSAGHFVESFCHGGRHFNLPGELMMFSHNFCYPWRNVNCTQYQSPLWYFALGDSPNWGYGIQSVGASLAAAVEPTPYHTMARLGQKRGLWKNGIKGFGDFFGEYAARMVTCDFVMQYAIRSKYGMPEISLLQTVYGQKDRYRIPNSEAPRMYGFNIVRLVPSAGSEEITVDFRGIESPETHADWRACIVAVDGDGRPRYSPLWNKGEMRFRLKPTDKHVWLSVAATPWALPRSDGTHSSREGCTIWLAGVHAPRFPWEVTLAGCKPGSPHRRQGDVINLDELYALNNGNKYVSYPIKSEVPIPLTDMQGPLAQEKLTDVLRRIAAAENAHKEKTESGEYDPDNWWEKRKVVIFKELTRRVKFLQRNAKGHRHPNGGGFVSDSARVAKTAYLGPNAMVLDGARVEGNACIHQYAVVHGPKTVIRGNAKIGGKAWVFGDVTVGGNARIIESASVTTIGRAPIGRSRASYPEGQGEISGNVVLKGEHFLRLCKATGQVLTGDLVMDYTPGTSGNVSYFELIPGIANLESGLFKHGRIYGRQRLGGGTDAAGLYANWQFNQPKTTLLEDSYVNNNGILHGGPKFDGTTEPKCIVFSGKDQYAEAPPSVADFGELTIEMRINRSSDKGGRLFDFGTSDTECFYLEVEDTTGKPALTALHDGKRLRVAASESVPVDKWVRLRVEMDGAAASIYIAGKQVAKTAFAFRPREVFIADHPEGNFIACSRNRDQFFKGRLDHFRIYRRVLDDFDAIGPPPFSLTQMQEWSEADQDRADAWEGRKRVLMASLNRGRYGQISEEIKRLNTRRSELYKATPRAQLEKRARDTQQLKRTLDQKIRNAFRSLPDTIKAEKVIKELRPPVDAIYRQISQNSENVKIAQDIKALDARRREIEKAIQESPRLKLLTTKAHAASDAMRLAEERFAQLPDLKKITESLGQEKDNAKKRKLQNEYGRLLSAMRASDPAWQKAQVARRRIENQQREFLRNELGTNTDLVKTKNVIKRLKEKQRALTKRLRESNRELPKLQEVVRSKQEAFSAKRRRYVEAETVRSKNDYAKVADTYVVAKKAVEDEKRRFAQSKEVVALAARVEILRKEQDSVRDNALKRANFFGRNPYPSSSAARMWNFQTNLKYHTSANWDERTPEEVQDRVTPTQKRWLLRVRGY